MPTAPTFYDRQLTINDFYSIQRNVLGRGGKFNTSFNQFNLAQKEFLIDTSWGGLMKIAMEVPHLNVILSRGAELFSLMEIKHLDKNGEEIEDSEIIKMLRSPNPLQNTEQLLYEFYILNGIYNKTFVHEIKPFSFEKIPAVLWYLPSGMMKVNTTGKLYRQTKIEDIISSYELHYSDGTVDKFEVDKVIYMAEGVGQNILNPISKVQALQIPLSNIVASLKARNIIVSERGAIGMISGDGGNDGAGVIPLGNDEKKRIEQQYQNDYSLDAQGRGHILITSASLKWTPLTFDVGQLDLLGGNEADFGIILAAYGIARDLFPSTKGATFENQAQSIKSTIQMGLQPIADKLLRKWSQRWCDNGERLAACYDHLPSMKEDERLAAQGRLYRAQSTDILLRNGTIDHEQNALLNEVEANGSKQLEQAPKPTNQNDNGNAN